MEQSETAATAVPTSADAWTDLNTFTVPAGVKRLRRITFKIAPDLGTGATSIRCAMAFRLLGSGLLEQNPHEYLGMFGSTCMTTDGAVSMEEMAKAYDVDIPVSTGGTYTVQMNSLDEAITAGTVLVEVIYDDKSPVRKNSMAQYVDATAATTAAVWTTVGTFTLPKPVSGAEPKKIKKILLGIAVDQGTSAISLRTASRFRLTGAGLGDVGAHEFVGPCGSSEQVGAGASWQDKGTVEIDVDLSCNAGGTILAEHIFTTEVPTGATAAVGLVYSD